MFVQAPFCLLPFSILGKKKIPNQLLARTLVQGKNQDMSRARTTFWAHVFNLTALFLQQASIIAKGLNVSGMGGKRWNVPLKSKVSHPKTDKPANYLRFLPSKMSRPRLLVPGSHTCFGPLTLLELWQLFHSNHEEESLETIVTIQFSLPSSALPMTRNRGAVPT